MEDVSRLYIYKAIIFFMNTEKFVNDNSNVLALLR